jgi:glutamine amidotransferase
MRAPLLGLIDYGSGNLRSVSKAALKVGAEVEILSTPDRIEAMDGIILPGVGAFGDCAGQLHQRELWEPLARWLHEDRPFLGICLGYQLLFETSEESPGVRGFGRFAGAVRRFDTPGLKVPQIGWNALRFVEPRSRLWQDLENGAYVYFVHSYYPVPVDESIISATADYGTSFAAAVEEGALSGVQFHPEKSQDAGLTMLHNFAASVLGRPTTSGL